MSFEVLPEELLIEQLLLLSPEDLLNTCQIDRRFSQVCQKSELWLRLLKRDFSLFRFSGEMDPKKTYLYAVLISRKYPEVELGDIRDPVAFYEYSSRRPERTRKLFRMLNDGITIQSISDELAEIPWDPIRGFQDSIHIFLGDYVIFFPKIFTEPMIGDAVLQFIHRKYPDLYRSIIENVRREIARKRELDRRIRYAARTGKYIVEYVTSDWSVHFIDLSDLFLPDAHSREELEKELLLEVEYYNLGAGKVQPSLRDDLSSPDTIREGHHTIQYTLNDETVFFEVPYSFRQEILRTYKNLLA